MRSGALGGALRRERSRVLDLVQGERGAVLLFARIASRKQHDD
jgi:hypothetical protein